MEREVLLEKVDHMSPSKQSLLELSQQIKRLKELEKEKDALYSGLEILERARLWYFQRLEENRAQQDNIDPINVFQESAAEGRSCLLRSCIQRVNGSLGSVMAEPNVTSTSISSLPDAVADSDLRWHNTVLTRV
ncbi:suppressor APC domain-containing protein 1 [Scomber scombrus]|uniref:Suppressor APC domain-containing protein 1 n=1 Tax=Scomber scombrus TaxID=13677 RepID=A0AAV1MSL1_SCOSC